MGTLRSQSAAHCVRKVYGSSISCQKLHTSQKDKRPWLRGTSYWWNEKNSRHLFLRKSNKILWNKTTRLHVIYGFERLTVGRWININVFEKAQLLYQTTQSLFVSILASTRTLLWVEQFKKFSEFQEACFVSWFSFELLISPAPILTLREMHYIGLFDIVVLMTKEISSLFCTWKISSIKCFNLENRNRRQESPCLWTLLISSQVLR